MKIFEENSSLYKYLIMVICFFWITNDYCDVILKPENCTVWELHSILNVWAEQNENRRQNEERKEKTGKNHYNGVCV